MTRVYVETSTVGYYFDDREPVKRDAVRRLFSRIARGELEGLSSDLTVEELRDAPPPFGSRLETALRALDIPVLPTTPGSVELSGGTIY